MHTSYILLLPVLSLAPLCHAIGSARVVNNCGATVYYASVSGGSFPAMQALPASGYSEIYSKSGTGVSIKVSTSPDGPVAQFEYTWTSGNGQISYDISNIDGNPFAQQGVSLVPSVQSSSKFPTCVAVNCPPGGSCSAAYNHPNDVATKVCSDDTSLTFTLCTSGKLASNNLAAGGTGANVNGLSAAVANGADVKVPSNIAAIKPSTTLRSHTVKATNVSGTRGKSPATALMQTKASSKVRANVQTKATSD